MFRKTQLFYFPHLNHEVLPSFQKVRLLKFKFWLSLITSEPNRLFLFFGDSNRIILDLEWNCQRPQATFVAFWISINNVKYILNLIWSVFPFHIYNKNQTDWAYAIYPESCLFFFCSLPKLKLHDLWLLQSGTPLRIEMLVGSEQTWALSEYFLHMHRIDMKFPYIQMKSISR